MRLALLCATMLAAMPAITHAAEPPASIKLLRSSYVLQADGTGVQTVHIEVAVTNDAAARAEGQQFFPYIDGLQRVEFVSGYTQKPDGTQRPVLPDAVQVQLQPGQVSVPAFDDRKRMGVVLPGVAGGDTLVTNWRVTLVKPMFPNAFLLTATMPNTIPYDEADFSVDVPEATHLVSEPHGPVASDTIAGGRHVYRWRYSSPAFQAPATAFLPIDWQPRLLISTIPDWDSFAHLYAKSIASAQVVTPAIQALADKVTAGASDKRDKARRLYAWVQANIRWVAIYVGSGSFIPHSADAVLGHGYGDCKDQVVLFEALLKASGVQARPVLINLGATYKLSGPPTLTAFNHMISYLPELDTYADTTGAGMPLGTLAFALYGKPIVTVVPTGSVIGQSPVLPAQVATYRLMSDMTLDGDGRITGHATTEAGGPFQAPLHAVTDQAAATGGDQVAGRYLTLTGWPGAGSLDAPVPAGSGVVVKTSFTLDARPGMVQGAAFTMPTGLRLLARAGDPLLGPLTRTDLPSNVPTPCYAGWQTEELALSVPAGLHPAHLPTDRNIHTAAIDFASKWAFSEGTLRVTRHVEARIAQPLCSGELRTEAFRALNEIRQDEAAQISLAKD